MASREGLEARLRNLATQFQTFRLRCVGDHVRDEDVKRVARDLGLVTYVVGGSAWCYGFQPRRHPVSGKR